MKKITRDKTVIFILISLLTFILSLQLDMNPFSHFLPGHDSSMFLYFGHAMDNGRIMYTEIFDHKGPMIFLINYFGAILSNRFFHGIYIMEFTSLFIYFLFTFKNINLWLSKTMSFLLLLPQAIILPRLLTGGNFTEEYALPFIAISLYIFSKYFIYPEKLKYVEIIILGISCAIVFSLRANMIVLWLVFCFFIVIEKIYNKEYRTILKFSYYFLLGLLFVFIPLGLYLYVNRALEAGIFQSLIFNFMYIDTTADKTEAVLSLFNILKEDYIVLIFALFLVYIGTIWYKKTRREKLFLSSILLFSLGSFLANTLSGRAYAHYLISLVPIMTLPTALLLNQLPKTISKKKVITLGLLFLTIIYFPQIHRGIEDIYVRNNSTITKIDDLSTYNQRILNSEKQKESLYKVVEVIKDNTDPEDSIYVHRRAGNLYLLSGRLSSMKYFNLPAINIDENSFLGDDFLNEFEKSDAELVVVSSGFHEATKTNIEQKFYDNVLKNYKLIHDDNGHFVYQSR